MSSGRSRSGGTLMVKTLSRRAGLCGSGRRPPPFQVLVGGGNQADVRLNGLIAAEALETLFLNEPEHLGLGGRAHVADLRRDSVPPWACSNLPMRRRSAPVKAPSFVARTTRFPATSPGLAGAVERQKRRGGAATMVKMARAPAPCPCRFAEDQHRDIARCHPGRWPCRRPAIPGLWPTMRSECRQVLRRQRQPARGGTGSFPSARLDHLTELVDVQRFEQILEGAALHHLDRRPRWRRTP